MRPVRVRALTLTGSGGAAAAMEYDSGTNGRGGRTRWGRGGRGRGTPSTWNLSASTHQSGATRRPFRHAGVPRSGARKQRGRRDRPRRAACSSAPRCASATPRAARAARAHARAGAGRERAAPGRSAARHRSRRRTSSRRGRTDRLGAATMANRDDARAAFDRAQQLNGRGLLSRSIATPPKPA